jgi:polar amino acid transport system substrate-binding protein
MKFRLYAALFAALLLAAACSTSTGGSPSASAPGGSASEPGASESGAASESPVGGDPNDLLAAIKESGKLRVSTDPNYAPQSFQKPDGTFEGFDIDVANEIAKRLGVEAQFEIPSFDLVVAGGWNGRWDVSVGSVTITEERKSVLDFTAPYYYTPAQMTATTASGITDLEGLAGKAICVGSSTTYQFWLEGTLELGDGSTPTDPPEGATASPLETDQLCAQAIKSGRTEFDGWLSSSTTVEAAIAEDTPVVKVGDPVFYEPLAVATDKNGPAHAELQAELDRIIDEMHSDGTLSEFSKTWFDGLDLTTQAP